MQSAKSNKPKIAAKKIQNSQETLTKEILMSQQDTVRGPDDPEQRDLEIVQTKTLESSVITCVTDPVSPQNDKDDIDDPKNIEISGVGHTMNHLETPILPIFT